MKKKILLTVVAAAAIAVSAQAQQAIILAPGEPYTLTSENPAVGTNGAAVSYQWYRNGNTIAGATSASYNLPSSEANGINVEFKRGATSPSCGGYNFSNTIVITFCNTLAIGTICWAGKNVDSYQQWAAIPDMYTKFYQWNRSTAWAATGSVSNWNTTSITDASWTVNPCPSGWRLPTQAEFQDLYNTGATWVVAASARGNTVAGCFYGPNNANTASCKLPSPMTNCIFLPANGTRGYNNGGLTDQGTMGHYWSNTQNNSTDGYDLFFKTNETSTPSNASNKARGYPIRCVQ